MNKIITVGLKKGDLTGDTELAIQAAVDYLSYIGGGTVSIGPGVFEIGASVRLRSNVSIIGTPGETVFRKCSNIVSYLATDGDANEKQLTLVNPEGFEPGHTITVRYEGRGSGFLETTAVITGKKGSIVEIDNGLIQDYNIINKAVAERNFSVISGIECENNIISGITVDGNKENNSLAGGCRNAGIYFFGASKAVIENCVVKNYNGDGISYQTCNDITVKDSVFQGNAGLGIHPGSGTTVTRILGCKSYNNGGDGIFVCWRVTGGLIEDNEIYENGHNGISIGHKDINNVIRKNRIYQNCHCGILFREELEPMGANYNIIENNTLTNNGSIHYAEQTGCAYKYAGIRIFGATHGVQFISNEIIYENADAGECVGIIIEKGAYDNVFTDNYFKGVGETLVEL